MEKNEDIRKANEELKQVSGDYELRRIAELKEKYRRDEKAALDYAIEKGQKEGIEQEKINIAKNMLRLNVSMNIIIEATGLSKEQVMKLN